MPVRGKPTETGAHSFGEEDRAAPAMRDAHIGKRGVQMTHTVFERAKTSGRFAAANIETAQIVHVILDRVLASEREARGRTCVRRHKASAEDDAVRIEQASPQIGKINRIKGATRRKADGPELCRRKRRGGKREGEFWDGNGAQPGQFKGEGVGGEQHFPRTDFPLLNAATKLSLDTQADRI